MPPRPSANAFRLRAAFASPHAIAWATAAALLIALPTLFHGFALDDHTLRGFLLHVPPWAAWAKSPLALFTFYDGDPERTRAMLDHGFGVWWTDPLVRIVFFRPLSAATHWLDFRLWPTSPFLMHVHTVAYYLALVVAAGVFYRRILGAGWVAGLAVAMFAVDHTHGMLIGWISNRNAVIAALFAVASLILHERARSAGRALLALASAACLALGLLAGEVALGAAGYLFASAVFLDDRSLRARLRSLAPHLAVLVAWALVYRLGDQGVRGSGMYVDPGQSPLAFLEIAGGHLLLLLQMELGGISPDVLVFVPHPSPLIYVAAAALVSITLVALWPLRGDRRARFFLTGAILSAVPATATMPAGRLMLLPGLGLLGLVALVVAAVVDETAPWRPGPARWSALFVAVFVGGGHVFISPLTINVATHQMWILERIIGRYGDAFGDDPALAGQRVVVVNPPDSFFAYQLLAQRLARGRVAPASLLVLATGTRGMDLERPAPDTLVVRSDGGFYRSGSELLTRAPGTAMPAGTRVVLSGVTIEVTRTDSEGVPLEASFHFARPLEDGSLRWFAWQGARLAPFALPAVGAAQRLEGQTPSL